MINKITRKHPHQRLIQQLTPAIDNSNKLILSAIITNYSPFNQQIPHQSEECKQIKKLQPLLASINPTHRHHSSCQNQERPLNHPSSLCQRLWKYNQRTTSCLTFLIQAPKPRKQTFMEMIYSRPPHLKMAIWVQKLKVEKQFFNLKYLPFNDR